MSWNIIIQFFIFIHMRSHELCVLWLWWKSLASDRHASFLLSLRAWWLNRERSGCYGPSYPSPVAHSFHVKPQVLTLLCDRGRSACMLTLQAFSGRRTWWYTELSAVLEPSMEIRLILQTGLLFCLQCVGSARRRENDFWLNVWEWSQEMSNVTKVDVCLRRLEVQEFVCPVSCARLEIHPVNIQVIEWAKKLLHCLFCRPSELCGLVGFWGDYLSSTTSWTSQEGADIYGAQNPFYKSEFSSIVPLFMDVLLQCNTINIFLLIIIVLKSHKVPVKSVLALILHVCPVWAL